MAYVSSMTPIPSARLTASPGLSGDFSTVSTSPDTPYQDLIKYGQHQAFNSLQVLGYEPRVGFAYSPFGADGKTTVRAGFGMFADAFPGQIADSFLNNAPTNVPFTILSRRYHGSAIASTALIPTAAGSAGPVQPILTRRFPPVSTMAPRSTASLRFRDSALPTS